MGNARNQKMTEQEIRDRLRSIREAYSMIHYSLTWDKDDFEDMKFWIEKGCQSLGSALWDLDQHFKT